MYTRCPNCLKVYAIDEDALQTSFGIVRCGHCHERFDALRTLSDTLPIEPVGPLPGQQSREPAPTLTEPVPPSAFEHAAKKSRSRKPTAPPAATEEPTPQPATGASADDWFTDIESELIAASNAPDAPSWDTDNDAWMIELPGKAGDDGASAEIEEAADTPAGEAGEPSTPPPSDPTHAEAPRELAAEVPAFEALHPLDSAPGDAEPEFDDGPSNDPDDVVEGATEAGVGEEPAADNATGSAHAGVEPEAPIAPAPVYVRPRRRFSRATAIWMLGCVLLALLLAAQLAWANRTELFRDPATQSWMARVCRNIPCHLPLIRDTAKLELLSRDVRPDPKAEGALMITATLRNDAAFSQPWPVVVVALTDLGNDPVAMRRFRPAEYMTDPARRAAGIAAGASAVVAFEVADPGKRAVAFQFGFE